MKAEWKSWLVNSAFHTRIGSKAVASARVQCRATGARWASRDHPSAPRGRACAAAVRRLATAARAAPRAAAARVALARTRSCPCTLRQNVLIWNMKYWLIFSLQTSLRLVGLRIHNRNRPRWFVRDGLKETCIAGHQPSASSTDEEYWYCKSRVGSCY